MISTEKKHSTTNQTIFLLGVVVGLALLLLGKLLIPTTNPVGLIAGCIILGGYGLTGYFYFPKIRSEILAICGIFGLLAGTIFGLEILLEYIILPKDNTSWGLIEFGSVFGLYWLSSLVVAYRRKNVRDGILTAGMSAMLSSLIWLIILFVTFYIFRGSARQEQVFLAEGNYQDFAQSGMTDFNAFVMEDFLGAACFHLVLGPAIAVILGIVGGFLGLWISRIKGPGSR